MRLTLRFPRSFILLLPLAGLLFGACSSLEPLPRFRTSSTSFAPDQLPQAQRSSKDLIDPATVASYSNIKEQAKLNADLPADQDEVKRLIVNQSASTLSLRVDELGLDVEEVEDELAEGDDFDGEDVPAVSPLVMEKVISQTMANAEKSALEANPSINRPEMMREIINLLGLTYRYGGMDATRGLDCSAFTGTVYNRALGLRLPRSSNEQFRVGDTIKRDDLKVGDLVFFKTRRRRAAVSHVGIYVGENLFAHASTKYGVIISSLDHPYYNRTYVGARRLVKLDAGEAQASR
ncbi:MAG: C40 family peptidase [Bacteroidia bacterium]|nr:C40 family peptidase [Bacteroidia bacterium]